MGDEAWPRACGRFAATPRPCTAAGVLIAAEVLQPSDVATTLRRADGTVQVQDGPFADTKEQLGGTFVVDVPDLDAALEWASQAPVLEWGAPSRSARARPTPWTACGRRTADPRRPPRAASAEASAAATPLRSSPRASYGRLVAVLAAGTGDLALAEDALGRCVRPRR